MTSPKKAPIPIRQSRPKTWRVVLAVVETSLKHMDSITYYEVAKIMRASGYRVRIDLILLSLLGKPYIVDCKIRTIYKG